MFQRVFSHVTNCHQRKKILINQQQNQTNKPIKSCCQPVVFLRVCEAREKPKLSEQLKVCMGSLLYIANSVCAYVCMWERLCVCVCCAGVCFCFMGRFLALILILFDCWYSTGTWISF